MQKIATEDCFALELGEEKNTDPERGGLAGQGRGNGKEEHNGG